MATAAKHITPDKLTAEERATLNEALSIIERCTAQGSSWQMCFSRYNTSPFSYDITYFDSGQGALRGQHSWVKGESFADKIQTALEIEANKADGTERRRLKRVEHLRKKLAELTGESV